MEQEGLIAKLNRQAAVFRLSEIMLGIRPE
jgi:hypothetical protein